MSVYALKLSQHYIQQEPISAARQLEAVSPEAGAKLLSTFSRPSVEQVFKALEPRYAAELLAKMPSDYAVALLASLPLSDAVAIMRFGDSEQYQQLLASLPIQKQKLFTLLMSYPDNAIGTLAQTNVLIIDEKMSVGEALQRIKKRLQADSEWVYITNSKKSLLGAVSLLTLLRKSNDVLISTLKIIEIPIVSGLIDIDTALTMSCWHTHEVVAISNKRNQFLGVVKHASLRRCQTKQSNHLPKQHSVVREIADAYSYTVQSLLSLASDQQQSMEAKQ